MVDDQLLISELAERAGVSVRTIRFYISEGLLPAPQAHGRYSVYDEEYLTRIQLIKLLKNHYLPLKEIKRRLESLSKAETESMLHTLNESAANLQAPAPDPQDFPAGAAAIKEAGLPEALDYISRVLKSQSTPPASPAPPAPQAMPAPVSKPASPAPHSRFTARANVFEELADAGAPQDQAEEVESSWRRYTIQPGVELLVSEQVYNQSSPSIHKIVAQVKQLFSSHPSGGKNV